MKTILNIFCVLYFFSVNAQISPILDYTWTIQQIDTGSQIINADLNQFGEYDTLSINPSVVILDNMVFYELVDIFFGDCKMLFSFNDNNSELFYHLDSCLLSDDNSSQIASYFNEIFIMQNTNAITIDNEFVSFANGPLVYSFSSIGDIIYLNITNTIGEVATFYASNLSQDEFLNEAITIYPNPVSNVLNIKNAGIEIENVKIYDVNGRLVKEVALDHNQIDLSQLPKGIYILSIETAVGILREKLIKN